MAVKRAVIWAVVSSKVQATDDKISLAYQEEQGRIWAEAIGGMEKSALTWNWMMQRATRFDDMFRYSFYEGGADMLDCLRHAHAYFTRTPFAESRNLTRAVLLNQLLPVLKQKRYLSVLDGRYGANSGSLSSLGRGVDARRQRAGRP